MDKKDHDFIFMYGDGCRTNDGGRSRQYRDSRSGRTGSGECNNEEDDREADIEEDTAENDQETEVELLMEEFTETEEEVIHFARMRKPE